MSSYAMSVLSWCFCSLMNFCLHVEPMNPAGALNDKDEGRKNRRLIGYMCSFVAIRGRWTVLLV